MNNAKHQYFRKGAQILEIIKPNKLDFNMGQKKCPFISKIDSCKHRYLGYCESSLRLHTCKHVINEELDYKIKQWEKIIINLNDNVKKNYYGENRVNNFIIHQYRTNAIKTINEADIIFPEMKHGLSNELKIDFYKTSYSTSAPFYAVYSVDDKKIITHFIQQKYTNIKDNIFIIRLNEFFNKEKSKTQSNRFELVEKIKNSSLISLIENKIETTLIDNYFFNFTRFYNKVLEHIFIWFYEKKSTKKIQNLNKHLIIFGALSFDDNHQSKLLKDVLHELESFAIDKNFYSNEMVNFENQIEFLIKALKSYRHNKDSIIFNIELMVSELVKQIWILTSLIYYTKSFNNIDKIRYFDQQILNELNMLKDIKSSYVKFLNLYNDLTRLFIENLYKLSKLRY